MPSLATTWGSTPAERAGAYPCDDVLPGAPFELFRAVSVRAAPPILFRWLCQLRVAPYSYDLIDNFGRRSPRALTPGVEALALGQRFMTIFTLASFASDEHVTLRIVPGAPRAVFGDLAVSYVVAAADSGARLVAKLRVDLDDTGFARLRRAALAWGDLFMMRKQLLTLKALAEASSTRATAP